MPRDRSILYDEVQRAAWLGLLINLALGLGKLAAGWFGDSFALLADSFNSLGDVITSVIVLFSLWLSQRPADKEHPYGHTRAETIAASNVCLLVAIGAVALGVEAVRRLPEAHAAPPVWTLGVAGINFAIKEGLYRYKAAIGMRTGSAAILANAWDHRSDAFSALSVLIGLSAVRFGGPAWYWADEAAALFVVAAILWSSLKLFRHCVHDLMDPQAEGALLKEVRAAAGQVEGVAGVEKLYLRKSGLEYFADIHIEVAPHLSVAQGHEIGHAVKDHLLATFEQIRDVLVHLEPAPRAAGHSAADVRGYRN